VTGAGSDCIHGVVVRTEEYEPSGQTWGGSDTSSSGKTPAEGARIALERGQCSIVRAYDDERVVQDD
jgi:hypothetical protein